MTKRVLVTGAANIGKAGVATIVYKWGQEFDSNVVIYDYLMQSGLPEEQYQNAIRNKGGIMFTCDHKKSMMGTIKWVTDTIRDNKYETIHINSDSAYIAAAYIYAAKRAGIRDIFVHSHCTQIDDTNNVRRTIKVLLHKICKPYVCSNTKMFLACSRVAGEWMFGKQNTESEKYKTIYNGVDVENYLFDKEERDSIRSELGLKDKFVLANVGRLSYQKNQDYLIKTFATYHRKNPDSMLVIVGDGELKSQLHNQVKALVLEDSVIFTGLRGDVPSILSAVDVLVMPSRFEGLPVTMVEAQMADLPCVVADTITREAKFTKNVVYVNGWNEEEWVDAIELTRRVERIQKAEEKRNSVFNIKIAALELQTILERSF
ncbi:MAG: glycosyltransferase [Lachnospiraceae bacterium]|nr:glycosyltransferase [Lachnospiraceae bacterium]